MNRILLGLSSELMSKLILPPPPGIRLIRVKKHFLFLSIIPCRKLIKSEVGIFIGEAQWLQIKSFIF